MVTVAKLGSFLGVLCVKALWAGGLSGEDEVQLLERNHLYPVSSVGR